MDEIKKRSPCAGCDEVYEVDWPEAVAFYCGGGIPWGSRVLIETQRLKHPRGSQGMITEGPLEGCPKGFLNSECRIQNAECSEPASGYYKAKEMLERSIRHAVAAGD